ncbi:MAG: GNAT family N-acetyltransferase [Verrucomicrobiota bacterium]
MLARTELRPKDCRDPRFRVAETIVRHWQFNRFMYALVGGDWAWTDKQYWSDEQWRRYVEDERLRTFAAYYDGTPAGYYELRRDPEGGIEIAYFGLCPDFVGRGLGGSLLTSALHEAWRMSPPRVWVHTCTLDHPAALRNYQARGMTVYRVERSEADPAAETDIDINVGFASRSGSLGADLLMEQMHDHDLPPPENGWRVCSTNRAPTGTRLDCSGPEGQSTGSSGGRRMPRSFWSAEMKVEDLAGRTRAAGLAQQGIGSLLLAGVMAWACHVGAVWRSIWKWKQATNAPSRQRQQNHRVALPARGISSPAPLALGKKATFVFGCNQPARVSTGRF